VIARQLGVALLTLLVISIVTFAATNYKSPEEVARQALGREAAEVQLDAYLKEHGLDKPIYVRYGTWLGDFVRGDFGTSPVTGRSVRDDIGPRFVRTLLLSLLALAVALPLSVALGVYMARRIGRPSDFALLIGTVIVAAMPEFVVGIGLLMLFAVTLGWLPVDSTGISFGGFDAQAKAYILPALTLVLAMVPHIARIARVSAREAFAAPFVQAAVLRGLSRRSVTWDHGMRNAAVPLVNAIAINIVYRRERLRLPRHRTAARAGDRRRRRHHRSGDRARHGCDVHRDQPRRRPAGGVLQPAAPDRGRLRVPLQQMSSGFWAAAKRRQNLGNIH
jgi:peptide/nickel transport system permease protein